MYGLDIEALLDLGVGRRQNVGYGDEADQQVKVGVEP